jgi:DNA-binding NtrC family response regulator
MIMVIDDDSAILEIIPLILKNIGYDNVLSFSEGFNAIEEYSRCWRDIDFVILDMKMPTMTGLQVFEELYKINPLLKVIISTGYSESEDVQLVLNKVKYGRLIEKPFGITKIKNIISEIMEVV